MTDKYYAAATIALVYYEYFLTLPDEVLLIWSGKKTWFSFMFILNRYSLLAYVTWYVVANLLPSYTSSMCSHTAIMKPYIPLSLQQSHKYSCSSGCMLYLGKTKLHFVASCCLLYFKGVHLYMCALINSLSGQYLICHSVHSIYVDWFRRNELYWFTSAFH